MPRAPKKIDLPLPRELQSTSLQAIQHHFELMNRALDNMYKLLLSDITTIKIGSGAALVIGDWIYFGGNPGDADTWRVGIENGKWVGQFWNGSNYVSKGGFTQ